MNQYISSLRLLGLPLHFGCDIRFPDSKLSRFHATIRRLPLDNDLGLILIPAGRAEILVNGIAVLNNVPVRLNCGDYMTVSRNRYPERVFVKFDVEESNDQGFDDLLDNNRTHISWQVGCSHYVRYLDDKDVYTIGAGENCDISTPYQRLHARLRRMTGHGITFYVLEKSPYKGCTVLINGEPLPLRRKMRISSGDVISASNGPHSVRLYFHRGDSGVVVLESTDSSHIVGRGTAEDGSRERSSRRSGKREMEENTDTSPLSKVETEECTGTKDELRKDLVSWFSEIEEHLTCSICFGIFYKPVNVSPCNHKFCLACISKWRMQLTSKDSCPECRAVIRSVGKDASINAIVSMFLDYFPEKSRTSEDILSMNKVVSGSAILPPEAPRTEPFLANSLYRRRDLLLLSMGNMVEFDGNGMRNVIL